MTPHPEDQNLLAEWSFQIVLCRMQMAGAAARGDHRAVALLRPRLARAQELVEMTTATRNRLAHRRRLN